MKRFRDLEVENLIKKEEQRQENELELIASENYASFAVRNALASVFINKYSEGYPGRRYYGGNSIVDELENLAIERAKKLFSAEHVNVQPLSGSPANDAVYLAFLEPGDKVMALRLDHGGHLSHGHKINFSGKLYNFVHYELDKDSERINMKKLRELALKERPKMILAGFSAYSRNIDWQEFDKIAKEVGAYSFADISHIAGLIAAKLIDNPVPFFDVVSSTTHKTLRGPRGAIIMSKKIHAKRIDQAVFPGKQGGPHNNLTAAKAIAFAEALEPSFREYSRQVIKNAKAMANRFLELGYRIVSGGTDNHMFILDLRNSKLNGKEAELLLEKIGISSSRSTVPNDEAPPFNPSGLRLGTPAISTRGLKEKESIYLANIIVEAFKFKDNKEKLKDLKLKIKELCAKFPLAN